LGATDKRESHSLGFDIEQDMMGALVGALPISKMRDAMEAVPPRLTLLFFAMPFQLVAEPLYWLYGREGNVAVIALCMALWFAWFALVFLMAVPPVDRWLLPRLRQLKRGVVVITVVLAVVGMAELVGMYLLETGTVRGTRLTDEVTGYFRYNDATAMSHQASETLLEGENPYTEANIIAALEKHPAATVTPLRQGDFAEVFPRPSQEQLKEVLSEARESGNGAPEELESKVSYPAGSFLFQTPLVALGLEDLRIFYLICAVAAGSIVLWRAPSALRPWAVAAFLVSVVLWNLIATGTIDTLYVLFVLLGWMLRSRLFVASVFMGLAAATKQIAWAYALFFLILVLRERGWKPAFSSAGVAAGVFAAINVPFIFDASRHWVEGILSPVLDPMFPGGVGVMAFSVAGILPPNPLIFTIMEAAVLLVGALWYYRSGYRYPYVGLVLAVLPFFFAWRSYSWYFYFASFLIFGLVLLEYRRRLPGSGMLPQPLRTSVAESQV